MSLIISPLRDIPLVQTGDDIPAFILQSLEREQITVEDGDILVIAQKIVSKTEGRAIALSEVVAGEEALELAKITEKDPRFVQAVLNESRKVLRARRGTLIVEHKLGFVCANAGIDRSNLEQSSDEQLILLLPEDPDASANRIREALERQTGKTLAVMIIDSFGRAWRNGVTGVAIGVSNLPALVDLRGEQDLFGYELRVTQVAAADQLAAAASLVMGEADERIPVVHVRGFPYPLAASKISDLIRDESLDLFR